MTNEICPHCQLPLRAAHNCMNSMRAEIELLRDQRDSNLAREVEIVQQLHAAVKTAQELAAMRLMDVGRLTRERHEYKIWWERDSKSLGTALNDLSLERACKQDLQAQLRQVVAIGFEAGVEAQRRSHEPGACTSRESDWCCTHCGRDNDPSETHCVHCEWSRKHTVAGVLHERGCEDNPCRCGALKSQGASRDASSEKSSVERLGIIKQTPRQASVDDIEWLCEKVEQLQAGILYEVENASLAPSARIRMRTLASGTHESEKPGYHCGKLKADCDDEFCPTHGRDIR